MAFARLVIYRLVDIKDALQVVLILMVVFTIVCMPVQLFLDCCCGQRLYTPPAEEAPKPDNPGTTDQPDTAPNAAENAV